MPLSPDLHLRFKEQAAWTLESRRLFLQNSGIQPHARILEAGCGTGAVLTSLKALLDVNLLGLDINFEMLQFARKEIPAASLTCGDAGLMPFPKDFFDAAICHYLLLWVMDADAIIGEFMRITRPGGVIAILAEPDYGSRIDYPAQLETIGKLQRESLIQQGANPDIGRRTGEILAKAGCINISTGILGSFNNGSTASEISCEQSILKSDLSGLVEPVELGEILEVDKASYQNPGYVKFIPTFFGWGFKPD